jgi:excisionase family DNA binding protein
MLEPGETLTIKEVARELGRSLEQVRRYVREGKLPAKKLGMQWFVSRRALEAFQSNGGRVTGPDILARIRANRERIKVSLGLLDVVELLEESRRSHP